MSRFSLGPDAWGTMEEFVAFDESADRFTIGFEGDNAPHENLRQQARNDGSNGFTASREMRRIIELSNLEILTIASLYKVKPLSPEFDDLVLRLAQDPDWKNIKTVDGGVRSRMR